MAQSTPQHGHINRLLQGLNNGFGLFTGGRGLRASEAPANDDGGENYFENVSNTASVVVADNVNNNGDWLVANNLSTTPVNNEASVISPNLTMARTRSNARPDSPSIDPPRASLGNPYDMEDAHADGYDSDGWQGPPTGTNEAEIDALQETPVEEGAPGTENEAGQVAATEQENPVVVTTPTHIDIPENDLIKLTVAQLKEELKIRKIPFPSVSKKAQLQEKLREALQKEMPVYSSANIANTTKPVDDLSRVKAALLLARVHRSAVNSS